jgi:hypothetical protein
MKLTRALDLRHVVQPPIDEKPKRGISRCTITGTHHAALAGFAASAWSFGAKRAITASTRPSLFVRNVNTAS